MNRERSPGASPEERRFKRKQSNTMWWLDIKLIKSVNDFIDANGHPIRQSNDGAANTQSPVEVGDIEI